MATKTHTTAAKAPKATAPKAPRKPRGSAVKKKEAAPSEALEVTAVLATQKPEPKAEHKAPAPKGRYIFATGRRKTAIANVRLFTERGKLWLTKNHLKNISSTAISRTKF